MSRLAFVLSLVACVVWAGFGAGADPSCAATRRRRPRPAGPPPYSTALAESVAREYLRKNFPNVASKPLSVESRIHRSAAHVAGEEVVVLFHELLRANSARSGNYIALRVKRGSEVALDGKQWMPVPPAASAMPAVTSSRAMTAAVAAVGSAKTHVPSGALLLWVDRHGKAVNRLAWRVPVEPRGGPNVIRHVLVDAQNGSVLAVTSAR